VLFQLRYTYPIIITIFPFHLYACESKVKKDEMGGACSTMGEKMNAEGKRPLGRPRSRWVDLREIGWSGVDWI
jgi:hypothetical protein